MNTFAFRNSDGTLTKDGDGISVAQVNAALSGKVDAANGLLTDPTLASILTQAAAAYTDAVSGATHSLRNSGHLAAELLGAVIAHDFLQAVVSVPQGTTMTQVNALAAYLLNTNSVTDGSNNGAGVAIWGRARGAVDHSKTWAMALNVDDGLPDDGGTGAGRILLGAEVDIGVNHVLTKVIGFSLTAGFSVQPTDADGFVVGSFNETTHLRAAYRTYGGAALYAFLADLATATPGTNTPSQAIAFLSTDGSGTEQLILLMAVAGRALELVGAGLTLSDGGTGLTLGAAGAGTGEASQALTLFARDGIGTLISAVMLLGTDGSLILATPTAHIFQVNGTTRLTATATGAQVTGTLKLSGYPTSDPHALGSVWMNSSNQLIVSQG